MKTIVIFAARSPAAAGIARLYGHQGYSVVLVGTRSGVLTPLAAELSESGIKVQTLAANLTEPELVQAMIATIRKLTGRIDAVYYESGQQQAALPACELNLASVQQLFDNSLFFLVALISAVLPEMRNRRDGAIVLGPCQTAATRRSGDGQSLTDLATHEYIKLLRAQLPAHGITLDELISNDCAPLRHAPVTQH